MGRSGFNGLTIIGAVFILIGVIVFVAPFVTVHETREVARLGDLKVQTTEPITYAVPPLLGGVALILGAALVSAGVLRGR